MEIIDINCMLGTWPDFSVRFHDTEGLLKEMASYNISSCVAFHSYSLWDMEHGNRLIYTIAKESHGKIKHCYVLQSPLNNAIMPDGPNLRKKLLQEKPFAIKLFPNTHRYLANEFYSCELFEILNELKLPVIFDSDQNPGYDKLPELAKAYPHIPFILLRQSLNHMRFILPLLRKTENIYFDVSIMCDTGFLEEIINNYGSERLLFGSGMPFYIPAGAYGLIFYARVSEYHRKNILCANWTRLEGAIVW
ncbi:MAG: amidohydrolase family protein [Phycisphaerales bacterium]